MNEEKELRKVLVDLYERRHDEIEISPAWLATEAMRELDPEGDSPRPVYVAAHLELRQIARSICRQKFERDESGEIEQHEMFPDLQARYPAAHSTDSEPRYVKLEHLTEADVRFNLKRLRAEASTKMAHADALEAWWESRAHPAA